MTKVKLHVMERLCHVVLIYSVPIPMGAEIQWKVSRDAIHVTG